jgi:hypothetical protein
MIADGEKSGALTREKILLDATREHRHRLRDDQRGARLPVRLCVP